MIDENELRHRLCNGFISHDGYANGRFTDLFADNGISQYDLCDEQNPYGKMLTIVIKIIQSMPIVKTDKDPGKCGRWIDLEYEQDDVCYCSKCGYVTFGKAEIVKRFNLYCSHCGVRMDGV